MGTWHERIDTFMYNYESSTECPFDLKKVVYQQA